jgi:glucose-6-phosphate isomerase
MLKHTGASDEGLDLCAKAVHRIPMQYDQNIDGCLADAVGAQGLNESELASMIEAASKATNDLRNNKVSGASPILTLPGRSDDTAKLVSVAEEIRSRFDVLIILGTGGSSLGGKAITALHSGNKTKLQFIDNLDPTTMSMLFDGIAFDRTGFLVISKSGATSETMAQYLVTFGLAQEALGGESATHFFVITDPTKSPLRDLASALGHTILDHDPCVGGRYSVLSNVGMLPTLVAGLNPTEVRIGAANVLEQILESSESEPCPPALGAAVCLGLARHRDVRVNVLMPYADTLEPFAAWHCQLWAESLGKDGNGTTPVRALGPIDQHSQLQLYLDGPKDKIFTIIETATSGKGHSIPDFGGVPASIEYLLGNSIGDLVTAQQLATRSTLIEHRCPTRFFTVPRIDERSMGALFMHFMLETIIAARMLGIDAFNQPAVEEGKARTRVSLSNLKTRRHIR